MTESRSEILRARVRVLQRKQKRIPHFELASVGMLRDESRKASNNGAFVNTSGPQ